MRNRFRAFMAFAATSLLSISVANAGSVSGTIGVSATVTNTCTLGSSTAVAFGSVPSNYTSAVDATGAIQLTCPTGVAYTVALDNGGNYSSGTRQMVSSGNFMGYQLYRSSSDRTSAATPWGATTGTDTQAGTGNGSSQSISVYGRVATGQSLLAGSYTDTVNITVTY